jgi:hypothetical protein
MHGRVPVVAERQIMKADGGHRRLHASAQKTASHKRQTATATMASLAGTEARNSENPPPGAL